MSDFGFLISDDMTSPLYFIPKKLNIQYQTSNIRHQTSYIKHQHCL